MLHYVDSSLTILDILPAVFWLHLNRAHYFSTPSKIVLTVINVVILAIGFAIVGIFFLQLAIYVALTLTHSSSVAWVYTSLENPLTRAQPTSAGLVLTTLRQCRSH